MVNKIIRRERSPCLVAVLLLLLVAGLAYAEVCKGSKVPKAELAQYDAQVELPAAEQETAIQTHLPVLLQWGPFAVDTT